LEGAEDCAGSSASKDVSELDDITSKAGVCVGEKAATGFLLSLGVLFCANRILSGKHAGPFPKLKN